MRDVGVSLGPRWLAAGCSVAVVLVWFLLCVGWGGSFMLFCVLLLVVCCVLWWVGCLGWGGGLVFLLLFACGFVVCVSWRFLFLLVLGMGCAFLLWQD